jgi:hypothetical protein
MKRSFLILVFLCFTSFIFSQRLIDNGPIIVRQPELSPDYVLQGNSWDHRILTYFFSNGTEDISGNDEQVAVRTAFSLWQDQTDLRFLEVCNSANADIIILWATGDHGDDHPFDGVNGILAHAFFPPPNGPNAGDIHFDDAETWTTDTRANGDQPIDLVTIAAHEIGHSLRLNHSTVPNALMYAYYTASHRYLDQDDINGIRTIYGNPGTYNFYSGSTLFCSSGTFSLNYVPPGCTVYWDKSSNITLPTDRTTNPIVATANGNGSGWVQATINSTTCGSVTLPQYPVWVGTPVINSISGPNPPIGYKGCTGQPYTFWADPARDAKSQSTYQWMVGNGNYGFQYQYQDWATVIFYDQNDYQVMARAYNTCGYTNWTTKNMAIMNCSYFLMYPNPASDNVTISLKKTATGKDAENLEIPSDYKIQIIDYNGRSYYSATRSGDSFTIPVNNLKDGNYYVNIVYGNKIESLPLIIKH